MSRNVWRELNVQKCGEGAKSLPFPRHSFFYVQFITVYFVNEIREENKSEHNYLIKKNIQQSYGVEDGFQKRIV